MARRGASVRLPESVEQAMWLSFVPVTVNSSRWSLDVLGEPLDPASVLPGGTLHVHAVWSGVELNDKEGSIMVRIAPQRYNVWRRHLCAFTETAHAGHALGEPGRCRPPAALHRR